MNAHHSFGFITVYIAMINSFFNVLNPVLTAIFYITSIAWLGLQIYYKIKKKNQ